MDHIGPFLFIMYKEFSELFKKNNNKDAREETDTTV